MLLSPSTGKRPRTRSGSAFCPSYPVLHMGRCAAAFPAALLLDHSEQCKSNQSSGPSAVSHSLGLQQVTPKGALLSSHYVDATSRKQPAIRADRTPIHSLQISGLNVEVTACISIADSIRYAKLTLLSYKITSTLITTEVNSSGFFIYEAV